MEKAAIEQGLPPDLARRMARATVAGSGALLAASTQDAADLRRAVTSPKGTTERALAVLMDDAAWPAAMSKAIQAATDRARGTGGLTAAPHILHIMTTETDDDALVAALWRVIELHGWPGLTMGRLAAESGVPLATLRDRFPSRLDPLILHGRRMDHAVLSGTVPARVGPRATGCSTC